MGYDNNDSLKKLLSNKDKLSPKEQIQLATILKQLQKEEIKTSLHAYIQEAWKVIEPGIEYIDNWHIEAICEYLQAVKDGQITRLLINMPPRYMKSIAVTVGFPTWVWINDPYKRFISLSYSQMLSKKHNINRRDIIKSPWYQSNWGNTFSLKDDMDTQIKFENDKTGFMFATSIGGTLTGEGADYIIVDDPHNPSQAQSDAERNTAVDFFRTTLPTRLNDKKKGAIVVVMQRLHEDDISGYCLKESGYEHLCLPAISERKQIITFPISLKQIIRKKGSILWSEREDSKELDQMKRTLGSYGFSGQYQQNPSPAEGGMVKRHWWKYYKELPQIATKIMSVDATFKDSLTSDFVSIQVWGKLGANMYLIDNTKARMDFPTTITAIKNMKNRHNDIGSIFIENKANGSAIISVLHKEIGGIIAVNPKESKQARVSAISPNIEAGNVYLPLDASWVDDYVEEWSVFPNGKHDDMVDAGSQAILKLKDRYAIPSNTNTTIEYDEDNPNEEYIHRNLIENVTGGSIPKGFFD